MQKLKGDSACREQVAHGAKIGYPFGRLSVRAKLVFGLSQDVHASPALLREIENAIGVIGDYGGEFVANRRAAGFGELIERAKDETTRFSDAEMIEEAVEHFSIVEADREFGNAGGGKRRVNHLRRFGIGDCTLGADGVEVALDELAKSALGGPLAAKHRADGVALERDAELIDMLCDEARRGTVRSNRSANSPGVPPLFVTSKIWRRTSSEPAPLPVRTSMRSMCGVSMGTKPNEANVSRNEWSIRSRGMTTFGSRSRSPLATRGSIMTQLSSSARQARFSETTRSENSTRIPRGSASRGRAREACQTVAAGACPPFSEPSDAGGRPSDCPPSFFPEIGAGRRRIASPIVRP